jgi:hypothetical protein
MTISASSIRRMAVFVAVGLVCTYVISYCILTFNGTYAKRTTFERYPIGPDEGYMAIYDSWHLYGTYESVFSFGVTDKRSLTGDANVWGFPKFIEMVYLPLLAVDRLYWHPSRLAGKWIM